MAISFEQWHTGDLISATRLNEMISATEDIQTYISNNVEISLSSFDEKITSMQDSLILIPTTYVKQANVISYDAVLNPNSNQIYNASSISSLLNKISTLETQLNSLSSYKLDVYPIGSIYTSVSSTNPSTLFGGTWEQFAKGKVIIGVDSSISSFSNALLTSGEYEHKLTSSEMPTHNHYVYNYSNSKTTGTTKVVWPNVPNYIRTTLYTGNAGGDQPHNNLQPYITCYIWRRTA